MNFFRKLWFCLRYYGWFGPYCKKDTTYEKDYYDYVYNKLFNLPYSIENNFEKCTDVDNIDNLYEMVSFNAFIKLFIFLLLLPMGILVSFFMIQLTIITNINFKISMIFMYVNYNGKKYPNLEGKTNETVTKYNNTTNLQSIINEINKIVTAIQTLKHEINNNYILSTDEINRLTEIYDIIMKDIMNIIKHIAVGNFIEDEKLTYFKNTSKALVQFINDYYNNINNTNIKDLLNNGHIPISSNFRDCISTDIINQYRATNNKYSSTISRWLLYMVGINNIPPSTINSIAENIKLKTNLLKNT